MVNDIVSSKTYIEYEESRIYTSNEDQATLGKDNHSFDAATHYKIDSETFDYNYTTVNNATKHENSRLHEFIISKIKANKSTILDVGCGNGWVATALHKKAKLILSSDVALKNVQLALRNTKSSNHYGLVNDGNAIPVRGSSIDFIITCEVLEHIEDPEAFISSLFSKVKPGGKLIITTPYKEVIEQNLCIHCNCLTPRHSHLHSINEEKLTTWTSGLDNEKIEYITFSNKFLNKLQTHVILKHFPFKLWKLIDTIANKIFGQPQRIMTVIQKHA